MATFQLASTEVEHLNWIKPLVITPFLLILRQVKALVVNKVCWTAQDCDLSHLQLYAVNNAICCVTHQNDLLRCLHFLFG